MKYTTIMIIGLLAITVIALCLVFFTEIDHFLIVIGDMVAIFIYIAIVAFIGFKRKRLTWR